MSLLLDTCVVSEPAKQLSNPGVAGWLAVQAPELLCVSAITIGELHFGARRLPDGKRRRDVENWIAAVEQEFAGRIVPVDETVAVVWGGLRARFPNATLVDAQIAATAFAHGLTLVTRNVRDFAFPGLAVFNPWSK